jgi:hypothetical protein
MAAWALLGVRYGCPILAASVAIRRDSPAELVLFGTAPRARDFGHGPSTFGGAADLLVAAVDSFS